MERFVIAMTVIQVAALALLARYVLTALAKTKASALPPDAIAKREARLLELYNHVEELMDVFESYIDEVRQDIEKDRLSLLEMSRQASTLFMRALQAPPQAPAPGADGAIDGAGPPPAAPPELPSATTPVPPSDAPPEPPRVVRPAASRSAYPTAAGRDAGAPPPNSRLSARDREALGRFATKPQQVRFLMGRGLPLEEVAREMGIGTGEVRLIAELEK